MASFFRGLFSLGRNTQTEIQRPRLQLEHLEDRVVPSFTGFTDYEQLLVELLNRDRANPTAAVTRYGLNSVNDGLAAGTISLSPKQPLAPHQALLNAAGAHSDDMLARNFFSHTAPSPKASTFDQRVLNAGYNYFTTGENLAWETYTNGSTVARTGVIFKLHQELFLSPGHRTNILEPDYDEIGTGISFGKTPYQSATFAGGDVSIVTENFGSRDNYYANYIFLTGVAYTDGIIDDDFYSVGEGLGGVTITATSRSATYQTTTASTGGYALRLAPGTYTVTASGGALSSSIVLQNVIVGWQNVKVDFVPLAGGPTPPVISAISDDFGLQDDGITNDNTLQIHGTGIPNSLITVYLDDNPLGTTNSNASGQWTFDHRGTVLADGSYSLTATTTYQGETSESSQTFPLIVRTANLPTPEITGISDDVPALGEGVTVDRTLVFHGTADPTTTVLVFQNGTMVGQTIPEANGTWDFDYTGTTLAPGAYDFQVQSVDLAAGRSAWSSAFEVSIVTNTAPQFPAIPNQTIKHNGSSSPITINATDPDGEQLSYSATVSGYSEAYNWDQAKRFRLWNSDYRNYLGRDEKWVWSDTEAKWYIVLPNGNLHAPVGKNIGSVLTNVGTGAWANLSKLYNAPEPPTPNAQATFNGNQLTITPQEEELVTFQITVTVTDQITPTSRTFRVTTTNAAPTFHDPLDDQQVSHNADTVAFDVSATDPDGETPVYTAHFFEYDELYSLDQELGLRQLGGSYYTNYLRQNEKWIYSDAKSQWHLLYPDGSFYEANGEARGAWIAKLAPGVYTNPALLHNPAAPAITNIPHSFNGGELNLDVSAQPAGIFQVRITAADAFTQTTRSFLVELTNLAPEFQEAIADHTISHSQDMLTVNVSATDGDGDAVNYSVTVTEKSRLYELDQEKEFFQLGGSYYTNYLKKNEKWVRSETEAAWYVVLPTGALHRSNGTSVGAFVEMLDSSVWQNPALLHNATPGGVRNDEGTSILNGNLSLSFPDNYAGTLAVTVSVTDNSATTEQTFDVAITNTAPEFVSAQPIPTQKILHTQQSFSVNVSATDSDGDPISYDVGFAGISRLHQLDQEKDFVFLRSYYTNYLKKNEKWIYSNSDKLWYVILPNGNLHKAPTAAVGSFVENVGVEAWTNPELLHDAQPVDPPALSYMVVNGQLTITRPAMSPDSFLVKVSANDGIAEASKTFQVNVLNNAPTWTTNFPNLELTTNQLPYAINFGATDLDGDQLQYSVEATDLLYDLDESKGFRKLVDYYQNYLGLNEKWIYSNIESQWYIIKPNGDLHAVPNSTVGNFVANVGADVWTDPTKLYGATNSEEEFLATNLQGNTLTIQSATATNRLYQVTMSVTDDLATTSRTFLVWVS